MHRGCTQMDALQKHRRSTDLPIYSAMRDDADADDAA